MPISEHIVLPEEDELKVQEVNISTPYLKAGALHFGKFCDEQCKEFMLCRSEENDARKCLKEGKDVTACGIKFFQLVKKLCRRELENLAACLEHNSPSMDIHFCQSARKPFDMCMFEKANIEKPPFGYFTEYRVHKTNRPKPEPMFPVKVFDDKRPSLPDDYPRDKTSPYGWNDYFF